METTADKIKRRTEDKWRHGEWEIVPKGRHRDRVLYEQGNCCAICKNPPTWMGQPLGFQLDHINGDSSNNTRANLRMLCPNCHFQTPTWGKGSVSEEGRKRMREAGARGRQSQLASRSSTG